MENPLAKRFDQFCIDNHVTIVRGNLYQVEKVTGYESCLDLLKNHPRCPVDVVQLKPSIDSVLEHMIHCIDKRIVYTNFSYTTFGVNTRFLGQDIIQEMRKSSPVLGIDTNLQ